MIRKTRQISTLTDDRLSSGRESSLHSAIKKWYLLEGDKPEAKVEDFTVVIARMHACIADPAENKNIEKKGR